VVNVNGVEVGKGAGAKRGACKRGEVLQEEGDLGRECSRRDTTVTAFVGAFRTVLPPVGATVPVPLDCASQKRALLATVLVSVNPLSLVTLLGRPLSPVGVGALPA